MYNAKECEFPYPDPAHVGDLGSAASRDVSSTRPAREEWAVGVCRSLSCERFRKNPVSISRPAALADIFWSYDDFLQEPVKLRLRCNLDADCSGCLLARLTLNDTSADCSRSMFMQVPRTAGLQVRDADAEVLAEFISWDSSKPRNMKTEDPRPWSLLGFLSRSIALFFQRRAVAVLCEPTFQIPALELEGRCGLLAFRTERTPDCQCSQFPRRLA